MIQLPSAQQSIYLIYYQLFTNAIRKSTVPTNTLSLMFSTKCNQYQRLSDNIFSIYLNRHYFISLFFISWRTLSRIFLGPNIKIIPGYSADLYSKEFYPRAIDSIIYLTFFWMLNSWHRIHTWETLKFFATS